MSYNFAVWEGPPPLSNAHAVSSYERLIAAMNDSPPVERLVAFVERLETALAASAAGVEPEDLWAAPIADQFDGAFLYFGAKSGRQSTVLPHIESVAKELGLVAFDPQTAQLMPSAITAARTVEFELPDPAELPLHVAAVIGEALAADKPMAGIIEQVETSQYVQWAVRDGGLLVEAQGDAQLSPDHQLDDGGRARMRELGFVEGDPNWTLSWEHGLGAKQSAAELLSTVLTEVRQLPVGTVMALQTFPL